MSRWIFTAGFLLGQIKSDALYSILSAQNILYDINIEKGRGEENKSRIYERYAVRLVLILFLTKNRRCGVLATGTPPFIQNRFLKIHDDTIHSI